MENRYIVLSQSIALKSFRRSEYNVVKARWIFWFLVAAFIWLMVSRQTEIQSVTGPLIR